MSTIAIYTYLTKGSELPSQPHNAEYWKARGFDFICFVEKKEDLPDFAGAWYIDELPISWDDHLMNAELPKLNPQSVLDGYEYSVWLDEGVTVTGDAFYENCKKLQEREVVYADLMSQGRRSVYSYAWMLYRQKLEPFKVVSDALIYLAGKGIFPWSGFRETAVLFRKHEDKAVLDFDRWWWECLLLRAGSHYDRLMHLFTLKDTPALKAEYLSPEGISHLPIASSSQAV